MFLQFMKYTSNKILFLLSLIFLSACHDNPHYEKQAQFEVVRCYAQKIGEVWHGISYEKMECFYHISVPEAMGIMEELYSSKKITKVCVSGDDFKRCR